MMGDLYFTTNGSTTAIKKWISEPQHLTKKNENIKYDH